jgi:hypothetical protein
LKKQSNFHSSNLSVLLTYYSKHELQGLKVTVPLCILFLIRLS